MLLDVVHQMRTTLSIDNDVLDAAKVLARHRNRSIGAVISDLARQALAERRPAVPSIPQNGRLPVLPRNPQGGPVDLELVNHLRDD